MKILAVRRYSELCIVHITHYSTVITPTQLIFFPIFVFISPEQRHFNVCVCANHTLSSFKQGTIWMLTKLTRDERDGNIFDNIRFAVPLKSCVVSLILCSWWIEVEYKRLKCAQLRCIIWNIEHFLLFLIGNSKNFTFFESITYFNKEIIHMKMRISA